MWGAGALAAAWAIHGAQIEPAALVQGLPYMADFVRRMVPPNVELAPSLVGPTLETMQMAVVGTLLAIVLAVPLGLLAAHNLSPHPLLYAASRTVLNALRGINEFVFALVFVSAVGLGPFPGVLALAVHTAGMLGKFYAEAIEGVDPGPVEGIQATGAGRLQTIRYAILPQVMPAVVAFNLYRFEVAVRSATVLGLVGAGGIGFQLMASMRLFKYQDVAMILVIILALVMVTDLASSRIRRRYL
jgi:phosphonate transport system permease protein